MTTFVPGPNQLDPLGDADKLKAAGVKKGAGQGPLMIGAEASTNRDLLDGAPFVVPNSMREVQPEINLLVSPVPERLFARTPEGVPAWTLPMGEEDC